MLWSAVHQPIGQGTYGQSNYLSAGQDFISLCVYYDLYGYDVKVSSSKSQCAQFVAAS